VGSAGARRLSVTVDANILVYASNRADPVHAVAVDLVDRLVAGPDLVYLFWPTIMAYLRLVTHPAVLPRALPPNAARSNIEALLTQPHVRSPGESSGFWEIFLATAGQHLRGNDVPDAHIAGLMRQHDVGLIYTRDRGFKRFPGVTAQDPFE